jgi:hypothetical protein
MHTSKIQYLHYYLQIVPEYLCETVFNIEIYLEMYTGANLSNLDQNYVLLINFCYRLNAEFHKILSSRACM